MSATLFGLAGSESALGEGTFFSRAKVPLTRSEWETYLDEIAPARHLFRDDMTIGLEKWAFNEVGAIFFAEALDPMRQHFLPHAGLWPVRHFEDPRFGHQYWQHHALHCWYGWPIPVDTTYNLYYRACFVGEILAAMETEFGLFDRFPEETKGMFNPSYPSTYEAFHAVGIKTLEEAISVAQHIQFSDGQIPSNVLRHPNFKGGVAVTWHRQAAWADHDHAWAMTNWKHQHLVPAIQSVYRNLWDLNRHRTIFDRHEQGRQRLIEYGRSAEFDEIKHQRAVCKSLLRTLALFLPNETETLEIRMILRNPDFEPTGFLDMIFDAKIRSWGDLAQVLIGFCDRRLGSFPEKNTPMPLWHVATEFHEFRAAWQKRLQVQVDNWKLLESV